MAEQSLNKNQVQCPHCKQVIESKHNYIFRCANVAEQALTGEICPELLNFLKVNKREKEHNQREKNQYIPLVPNHTVMEHEKKHKSLIDRWDVRIFLVFGFVQWLQLSEKLIALLW